MMGPDDVARIRANFGFDQPVIVQYGLWLKRVLVHGDFGYSYVTGEPVIEMIWQRLPATLELMGAAFLLAFLFGLSGGIVAALKRYTKFDSVIMLVTLFGISIPVFWLGLMSMMLFTVKWRLLPSTGMFAGVPSAWTTRHLLMPALVSRSVHRELSHMRESLRRAGLNLHRRGERPPGRRGPGTRCVTPRFPC
jgi:ABC-type dipeptide/oligopeptide/nickel transport system permease component